MKPVGGWLGKKFFHRDSLSPYLKLAVGLKLSGKGFHAGKHFASAPAFDLNGHGRFALLQDEIYFLISFTPVGHLDVGTIAGIEQMRADARFDEPAPIITVLPDFGNGALILCAHKGSVQYLKFGAGTTLTHLAVCVFGKPCQHPCALQQFEVVSKCCRVSCIGKLANHFLIGKDLAGIGATKLE